MSSLLLLKRYLMNICFRSVLDTKPNDEGRKLRLKRIRIRNLRTRILLLLTSLMMTRNHVILPNLSKRTRAKGEMSHLLHRRRNLLYLRLSAYIRQSLCNAQSRHLLHRSDRVSLRRHADLGESG